MYFPFMLYGNALIIAMKMINDFILWDIQNVAK